MYSYLFNNILYAGTLNFIKYYVFSKIYLYFLRKIFKLAKVPPV